MTSRPSPRWWTGACHSTAAPDNQTHSDSLQIVGGSNVLIQNNNFQGGHNSALMITQDRARVFGIRARPWEDETDRITRAVVGAQLGKAAHVA